MKVIGIIPARYKSTRFEGKPLADICGKPMIWWVYEQMKKVKEFEDIFVAIDDEKVRTVCELHEIKYIMTSDNLPEHITRIHEVSNVIEADYYICINGDEPLISSECVSQIIPNEIYTDVYFGGAMRILTDPVETIDPSNIKVLISDTGRCIYMSRTPVPFPKGSITFKYNKYVGIECFNKKALDFFVSKPMGSIEKIEDIDHLRFIENGINLNFKYIDSTSISVDTPKDLEYVKKIIEKKIQNGLIKI